MEEIADNKEIKQYDVFSFNERGRTSNHCWDGRLVAVKRYNGSVYLLDTYWSSKYDQFQTGSYSKWFEVEDAVQKGELRFICNLLDVEEISEEMTNYYAEEDVFNLSYQHSCYKYFVKKKGADKSQSRMIEYATYKLERAAQQKSSSEAAITRIQGFIERITSGDKEIIIY